MFLYLLWNKIFADRPVTILKVHIHRVLGVQSMCCIICMNLICTELSEESNVSELLAKIRFNLAYKTLCKLLFKTVYC